MKNLYPNRVKPNHKENIRLARLARQGDLRARQKLIEANAGLAYNNALRYSGMNRARTQIDPEDILQSAMIGLIEAVDSFDPEKGFKFVTYAHWWVNKRISEEIFKQHWNTVKPPEGMARGYLFRHMDDAEQGEYVNQFMGFCTVNDVDIEGDDLESLALAREIMNAASTCGLSPLEHLVFIWMHSPDVPPATKLQIARELDITQKQVSEAEDRAISKIRDKMESDA